MMRIGGFIVCDIGFETDPNSDKMIESFASISARNGDWQQFERMVDSLIVDVRPPRREIDNALLLEAQMVEFPTSRVLAVGEAFREWMTDNHPDYDPPIGSFICYVHNNTVGLFYEIDRPGFPGLCYRGQRYGIEPHQYQSGF